MTMRQWGPIVLGLWATAIGVGLGVWIASFDGDRLASVMVGGAGGLFLYWFGRQSVLDPPE